MGSDQKRAFLAVMLSGLVLFVWQIYFAPEPSKTDTVKRSHELPEERREERPSTASKPVRVAKKFKSYVDLKNANQHILLSNFLSIEDAGDKGRGPDFKDTVGSEVPLSVELLTAEGSRPLKVDFSPQTSAHQVEGVNRDYKISFKASLRPDGKFNLLLNSPDAHRYRIIFRSSPKDLGNGKYREFVAFKSDVERHEVGDEEMGSGAFKWFGVDFNYHLAALILDSETINYQTTATGNLIVDTVKPSPSLKGTFIFTKKNYDDLVDLGENLKLAVDFGFFGILAVPILRGLQFFYRFLSNFGLAIIVVTLIIRLLTFPLQYKSFKSMKKIQVLQPELAKLKEKFKDDPQRMQKETMALFKRTGANPLGGCFPMLLQMPIFFAFYQVLNNAVELVEAPFYFWIHDLSVKDPYYVLPVLMTIVMLLQNKLNPSTSPDPTQKKIMYLMPIVFGFIMKDLPAGLNLYITVSVLFGCVQQLLVYRATE